MNTSAMGGKAGRAGEKKGGKAGRVILWILIVLLFLALLAFFGIGFVAAEQVTAPERKPIDPTNTPAAFGLSFEDVTLKSKAGDVDIAAWYIPSADQQRAIILVHGRDANRTVGFEEIESETSKGHFPEFAAAMQKAGFSVLMIDLRGHGESGQSQYTFGILERGDVQAAVDWLADKGYQPGKIGIFGLSLGSASSVGAAYDDPRVGALVLDSLFADLNPMIQAQWKNESGLPKIFLYSTLMMVQLRYGVDLRTARPIDEIVQFAPRPILLIHCTDDELIPISQMEELKVAVPSAQTWAVPGCIHPEAYFMDPQAYTEKVIGFFSEAIP